MSDLSINSILIIPPPLASIFFVIDLVEFKKSFFLLSKKDFSLSGFPLYIK